MIDNTNKDELIEQYLLGELTGSLLDEFKEKVSVDEQFRREVALQNAIIRNIRAAGRREWIQKLERIHNEGLLSNENEKTKPIATVIPIKRFKKKSFFLAAAIMLFIVFSTVLIITINDRPNTEHIFLTYYKPYPMVEQTTRGERHNSISLVKNRAFDAYNRENYIESIRLFKEILTKGEDEIILFYLGNALLFADHPAEAEVALKRYLQKYKEFAPEAKWYLSLSYLEQGKEADAKKLLKEISSLNNDYSAKAEEILREW